MPFKPSCDQRIGTICAGSTIVQLAELVFHQPSFGGTNMARTKTARRTPVDDETPAHDALREAVPLQQLPESWHAKMAEEFTQPYFQKLREFEAEERRQYQIFPPVEDVFNAFKYTLYEQMNVLLLGQDPYHDEGQAHGLCFSVRPGVKPPPSLRNMFKELHDDAGCKIPNNGCLEPWARQGILLLNAVLTVRAHEPNSHKGKGWEHFTDAAITAASAKTEPVVFVLWGAYAQKKIELIDTQRHTIIQSAHPSPLSAKNGFFGSQPFSKINAALKKAGKPEIDWQLPDV
jgi:uracil-DNA glycosylase